METNKMQTTESLSHANSALVYIHYLHVSIFYSDLELRMLFTTNFFLREAGCITSYGGLG